MRSLLTIFCLAGLLAAAAAQTTDSIPTDSLYISPKKDNLVSRFFQADYPSPVKAVGLSLILPGAGQVYNKKYWKLPIVYGAFGGLIYAVDYNNGWYRRLQEAYASKLDGLPHEFENTNIDNVDNLRRLRDEFQKNMELSYIGLFAVYALTAVDAFTSAHLATFDVNEDLSLRLQPVIRAEGLSLVITLRRK